MYFQVNYEIYFKQNLHLCKKFEGTDFFESGSTHEVSSEDFQETDYNLAAMSREHNQILTKDVSDN